MKIDKQGETWRTVKKTAEDALVVARRELEVRNATATDSDFNRGVIHALTTILALENPQTFEGLPGPLHEGGVGRAGI